MPLPKSPTIRFRRSSSLLRLRISTTACERNVDRARNCARAPSVASRGEEPAPSARSSFRKFARKKETLKSHQNEPRSSFRINKTYPKRCENEPKRTYGCDRALGAPGEPDKPSSNRYLDQAQGAGIDMFASARCARICHPGRRCCRGEAGLDARAGKIDDARLSVWALRPRRKKEGRAGEKGFFKKWGEANPQEPQNQQLVQKQTPKRTHRKSRGCVWQRRQAACNEKLTSNFGLRTSRTRHR
jgi:hypothetical protein